MHLNSNVGMLLQYDQGRGTCQTFSFRGVVFEKHLCGGTFHIVVQRCRYIGIFCRPHEGSSAFSFCEHETTIPVQLPRFHGSVDFFEAPHPVKSVRMKARAAVLP